MKKNNPWKKCWDIKAPMFGNSLERTYVFKIYNGWLVRHVIAFKKDTTSSAILFLPDSNLNEEIDSFEIVWELIFYDSNPNMKTFQHRAKTPQGWVIKDITSTIRSYSNEGNTSISLSYVPDKDHLWDL